MPFFPTYWVVVVCPGAKTANKLWATIIIANKLAPVSSTAIGREIFKPVISVRYFSIKIKSLIRHWIIKLIFCHAPQVLNEVFLPGYN